jgi:hypothetical protein
LKELREAAKLEEAFQPGIWEVFRNPKYRACTIFVVISSLLNQFCGINAVGIDCT